MSELWLEVTLPVPAEKLDRVCDVLTGNGMTGLVVEEEGDFLRFLEQNRQYWDYVDEDLARRMKGASRVKFYVPDSDEGRRQLRQYLAGLEEYEPQTVSLREEDWATSWQKYYQPIPVGKRISSTVDSCASVRGCRAGVPTGARRPGAAAGAAGRSSMVFHAPQAGHFPCQRESSLPQAVQ